MSRPHPALLIAVLEDDPGAAQALAALLEDWGYGCVLGDRLESVVAQIATRLDEVSAIISDYHLPGGATGVDAIARLRELGATAPALILTATLAGRARRRAGAAGHTVMEKPVAARRLKAWLDRSII